VAQWHSGSELLHFFLVVVVLQDISMQQAMLVGWKTFVGLEQGGIYRWTLRLEHICRSLRNLTVTWAFWGTFDRFPRCTSTPNADWSNLALQLDLNDLQLLQRFKRNIINIHHLHKINHLAGGFHLKQKDVHPEPWGRKRNPI